MREGNTQTIAIGPRLGRDFFAVDSQALARALLGRLLVRRLDDGEVLAGRIVETEAYAGERDRASHAFGRRRSERNESMYGPPGTAYVYFIYGMHYCMNVVCGEKDQPLAVLLRALEPVAGMERMARLRAGGPKAAKRISPEALCAGPARLCRAMDIDRRLDGLDLVNDPRLHLAEPLAAVDSSPLPPVPDKDVARTARIGVEYAGAWALKPLRWVVSTSPCLSVPLPERPPRRRPPRERTGP